MKTKTGFTFSFKTWMLAFFTQKEVWRFKWLVSCETSLPVNYDEADSMVKKGYASKKWTDYDYKKRLIIHSQDMWG